jgi:hypothetical protein
MPMSEREIQRLASRIKAAKFKDAQVILRDALYTEFDLGVESGISSERCSL